MPERKEGYGKGRLVWIEQGPGECVARLIVNVARGADGKRHRRTFTLRGTKRQIERERTRIMHEANQGSVQEQQHCSVAQYLDYWMTNAVRPKLSARTVVNYGEYVSLYIVPALGGMRLTDLTPARIQGFYTNLLQHGRRRPVQDGSHGLSTTTVANLHRVLHQALEMAVTWRLLPENPAKRVAVPAAAKRKPVILSPEQVAAILEETNNPRLRLLVLLSACTGMRRGECLGLRWTNVDFARGLLHITHSLVDTGEEVILKAPKTEAGMRPVKMPLLLSEVLLAHRAEQEEYKALFGTSYHDGDYIICWEDGRPVHPHRFYKPLKTLLRRLGLPETARLHDLRHSHASHLLTANVHPKAVSERLGHEDIETTLNIYSHVLPHVQDEAAAATDTILRAAMSAQAETASKLADQSEEGTKKAQKRDPNREAGS